MRNKYIQVFGWYGVVAILGAYFLVSFSYLVPGGLPYQLLNFTGSLGIAMAAYSKKDRQPLWLNIIWMLIGAVVIARLIF
ncbi:MAG: hypothetical protein HY918_00735 [Candidatus Doudnabacteria bacterium]|nr:hypothetical protein [Candidatus Doudnabacteria bacterium]